MRIIIEGVSAEGKTTIARLIVTALQNADLDVDYAPPDEDRVDDAWQSRRLAAIRKRADPIVVEERHLARRPRDV